VTRAKTFDEEHTASAARNAAMCPGRKVVPSEVAT